MTSSVAYYLSHFRRESEGAFIDDLTLSFRDGDPERADPFFPRRVPAHWLPDGVADALKAHFFAQPYATVWMLSGLEADYAPNVGFIGLEVRFIRLGAPGPASGSLTRGLGMQMDLVQQVLTSAGFGLPPVAERTYLCEDCNTTVPGKHISGCAFGPAL